MKFRFIGSETKMKDEYYVNLGKYIKLRGINQSYPQIISLR